MTTIRDLQIQSAGFQIQRATEEAHEVGKEEPEVEKVVQASLKTIGKQLEHDPSQQHDFQDLLKKEAGLVVTRFEKGHQIKSGQREAILNEVAKIAALASKYRIALCLASQHLGTQALHPRFKRYDQTETVFPKCVTCFDKMQPHTIPLDKYLDIRMSRSIRKYIGPEKEVDIFIGPEEDIDRYYCKSGFKRVARLHTNSSVQYFLLENRTGDKKVVVTGISNNSKFSHVTLQLLVAGAQLQNINVRGNMNELIKSFTAELQEKFSKAVGDLPIAVGIIGNRSEMVLQLAERLFPVEMSAVKDKSKDDREELAERLLKQNQDKIQTKEVGGGIFRFTVVKVSIDGEEKAFVAFRMPNGDLAKIATQMMLNHNAERLLMVGAGGSLSEKSKVGDYQLTTIAHKEGEKPIKIPAEHLLKLAFANEDFCMEGANETVTSPLVETDEWFQGVQGLKSSVDVETFYIFQALQAAMETTKCQTKFFPGLFISDQVKKEPLVKKINVKNAWPRLPHLLNDAFDDTGLLSREVSRANRERRDRNINYAIWGVNALVWGLVLGRRYFGYTGKAVTGDTPKG